MKPTKNPANQITSRLMTKYPDWTISVWNVRRKRSTKNVYRYDMQMHPKHGWIGGYIDGCEMTVR